MNGKNEWMNETRRRNNVIEYYVQVKPKRPQFYNAISLINEWTLKQKGPQSAWMYTTYLLYVYINV